MDAGSNPSCSTFFNHLFIFTGKAGYRRDKYKCALLCGPMYNTDQPGPSAGEVCNLTLACRLLRNTPNAGLTPLEKVAMGVDLSFTENKLKIEMSQVI